MFSLRRITIFSSLFALLLIIGACSDAFRADDTEDTIIVSGQVTNQANGQPVASALVEITSPSELQQTATTDADGQYSFTIQSEETVNLTIEASKTDFETVTQNLTATPGSDFTDVNLSLTAIFR